LPVIAANDAPCACRQCAQAGKSPRKRTINSPGTAVGAAGDTVTARAAVGSTGRRHHNVNTRTPGQ
jgi:hypothetical protein